MFVYCIKNTTNGKVYIGQSSQKTDHRLQEHRSKLRSDCHENRHLQRAWNKYGERIFTFEKLIETNSLEQLNKLETRLAKQYNATNREFGYNIRGTGDNRFMTDETKQLISKSKKGVPVHTKSSKRKLALAARNRTHTKESRLKRSQKLKGYVWPDVIRDQWAVTHRDGKQYPSIVSPDGSVHQLTNMTRFCKEHNLLQQSMSKLVNGQLNHHRNWRIMS